MKNVVDDSTVRFTIETKLGEITDLFSYHLTMYKKYKREIANLEKRLARLAKTNELSGHESILR